MASLDIFNSDAFSVTSLTAAINEQTEGQRVPTIQDNLFTEEGITTTTAYIEKEGDSLTLVPAGERGVPGDPTKIDKRDLVSFNAVHLPTVGGVTADEVQNLRAMGSETDEETVARMVQKKLIKMRRRIEATIAFQRMGAIKGIVYDSNGSTVINNLFTAFGISQQSVNMALGTTSTKVRTKALDAKRKSEDVIGDSGMITGWLALCGRGFFDALIGHSDVKTAYERWMDGEMLRNDPRSGFSFAGINWREYYGKVGEQTFVDTDEAYLIPLGVDSLFETYYAPADYMETVNTLGVPFYAKQEPRRMNKGIDLEAQSNPINLCTRPRSIIKLTKS